MNQASPYNVPALFLRLHCCAVRAGPSPLDLPLVDWRVFLTSSRQPVKATVDPVVPWTAFRLHSKWMSNSIRESGCHCRFNAASENDHSARRFQQELQQSHSNFHNGVGPGWSRAYLSSKLSTGEPLCRPLATGDARCSCCLSFPTEYTCRRCTGDPVYQALQKCLV